VIFSAFLSSTVFSFARSVKIVAVEDLTVAVLNRAVPVVVDSLEP
jgi:hypothetical protein